MKGLSIKEMLKNAKEEGRQEVIDELLTYIKKEAINANISFHLEKYRFNIFDDSIHKNKMTSDMEWWDGARKCLGVIWGKIFKIKRKNNNG